MRKALKKGAALVMAVSMAMSLTASVYAGDDTSEAETTEAGGDSVEDLLGGNTIKTGG